MTAYLFRLSKRAPNTLMKCFLIFSFTSAVSSSVKFRSSSRAREVTALSLIPQGMMYSKYLKSVFTFSANPCIVTHLEVFTPRAHIFLAYGRPTSSQTPVSPSLRSRSEEHTSELQSRENLVCRLLLEKKKTY